MGEYRQWYQDKFQCVPEIFFDRSGEVTEPAVGRHANQLYSLKGDMQEAGEQFKSVSFLSKNTTRAEINDLLDGDGELFTANESGGESVTSPSREVAYLAVERCKFQKLTSADLEKLGACVVTVLTQHM